MYIRIRTILFTTALVLTFSVLSFGQKMGDMGGKNLAEMKFTTLPPLPTCAKGSVASGDPSSGSSIILAKIASGCSIPWHWHTPDEQLMIVSGTGRVDMKDAPSVTLSAGGFALMPSKHIHQFTCEKDCQLYIYSNVAFDLHYVDKDGKEIPAADALKAVKEAPATEMK